MAIKQLTDEQIRDLDPRAEGPLVAGERLAGRHAAVDAPLGRHRHDARRRPSLTNLYVGAKTGWTLGVGITSVILAFAMFKVLSRIGPGPRVHRAGEQLHAVDRHGGRLHDRAA